MSQKLEMLYEGKAKQIYLTENPEEVVVYFKDDATAFNAQKRGSFQLKGEMNNAITTLIFEYLQEQGVETHFIKQLNEREQLVKKVDIIPLEMVVRNYAAGSMAQRLGVEEGIKSPVTIFDICYKKDELGDPLINDHHAVFLGAATYEELKEMDALTDKINEALKALFDKMNISLVDFKIELGKTSDGKIVLADEISPDEAYVEIYNRLKNILGK